MAKVKVGYIKDAPDFDLKDTQANCYITNTRFQYAILEKVDGIRFEEFGKTTDYIKWTKGRLFGEKSELKWQMRNGRFYMVITTEEDLPAGFHLFSDRLETLRAREVFLWGEKIFDGNIPQRQWYEARIPQILEYPLSHYQTKNDRIKIVVQEYKLVEKDLRDEEFVSIFHRFVTLKEA